MVRGDEKCVRDSNLADLEYCLSLIAGYVQSSPAAFERTVKYLMYRACDLVEFLGNGLNS